MTVSSSTNKATYVGNGALTVFAYTYRMDNIGDMEVYLNEVIQPSGYTVNLNSDHIGGDVTFDVAPAQDAVITLLRVLDLDQETDYVPYDAFPAEAHEDALDKLTMISQQLQEGIDRNTQAIGGEEGVNTQAPPFEANKAWKWSGGNPDKEIINSTYDPDEQATIATNQANNATNSANNASASASDALASENKAQQWSENPEDVQVEPGEYSAFHWAKKSEASSASGEANTSSNAGTGEGLALPKSLVDLPFKSIKVTGNGSIASDADSVTIQVDGSNDHTTLLNRDSADQHPQSAVTDLVTDLSAKAPLASPALTGNPTAPTASVGTNTTQVATTAFVKAEPAVIGTDSVGETELDVSALQASGLLPTAWCSFDGTLTGTNPPTAGYNVTSVERTAAGAYTINFTDSMDNANFSAVAGSQLSHSVTQSPTTANVGVRTRDNAHVNADTVYTSVQVFGGKN